MSGNSQGILTDPNVATLLVWDCVSVTGWDAGFELQIKNLLFGSLHFTVEHWSLPSADLESATI